MERFGEKLRALRLRRGLTLQELTADLGYSGYGYFSELETGRKVPTVALVLKVARKFDVSTDVLLKDELELPRVSCPLLIHPSQTLAGWRNLARIVHLR